MRLVESALWLAVRARPVLPLHWIVTLGGNHCCSCGKGDCDSPGKHPLGRLVPHGVHDASTSIELIKSWWRSAPLANIGMATKGLVVLDSDPRHGGDETLKALEAEHGALPLTPRSLTGGGGEHIFFKAPADIAVGNYANKLGRGIDIRANGGYVVAPPSLHVSGRRYAWSVDHHPDNVRAAPLPDWIVEALKPKPVPVVQLATVRPVTQRQAERQLDGIIRKMVSAREGERNALTFWGACRLRELVEWGDLSETTAHQLVLAAAMRTGLSATEAERTFQSAFRQTGAA
jgi:Bifunctional DNA primase/polymerase, N-terminal